MKQLYKKAKGIEDVDQGISIGAENISISQIDQIATEFCRGCNLTTVTTWNLSSDYVVIQT